jgi:hypothetical protein
MTTTDTPQAPQGQPGWAGSYPPLPPYPHKPQRPPAPRSIQIAVALMYAGLAGSLINMIIWAVGSSAIKKAAHSADPAIAQGPVNGLVGAYVAIAVIIGLISAGSWVWMALANKHGQSWARIASTVLFGVYTLAAFLSFVHVTVTTQSGHAFGVSKPVAGELTTWLIWLIALAAIIALWQHQSSAYYAAVKGHDPVNLAGQYLPYAPYAAYIPYAGQQYSQPSYEAAAATYGHGPVPPSPPGHRSPPPGHAQPPPPAVHDVAPLPPQAPPQQS